MASSKKPAAAAKVAASDEAKSDEVNSDTPEEKAVKAVDDAEIAKQATASKAQAADAVKVGKQHGEPEKVEKAGYAEGDPLPVAEKPVLDADTAKAQKSGVYIVAGQETLADIATKFGIGTELLAQRNHLSTGYRTLRPGQEIRLYETV